VKLPFVAQESHLRKGACHGSCSVGKVQARKTQQTAAIHNLGENRETIVVERSADELDQTGQSADREFAVGSEQPGSGSGDSGFPRPLEGGSEPITLSERQLIFIQHSELRARRICARATIGPVAPGPTASVFVECSISFKAILRASDAPARLFGGLAALAPASARIEVTASR
jgi:hypothetical protein